MKEYTEQAQEILNYCRFLYDRDYISGVEGNVSIRLSKNSFMITPRGLNKGLINAGDMIICDQYGKRLQGDHQPSSEVKIHSAIYSNRGDVGAVCHTHPTFATAFALAGKTFHEAILPEFVALLGVVPLVKYATPGSEDLVSNLMDVLGNHDAFLLERHGSLTLGKSMMEAYNRTETLEQYSKLLYYAGHIKSPALLSRKETERLLEMGGRPELKGNITTAEDKR